MNGLAPAPDRVRDAAGRGIRSGMKLEIELPAELLDRVAALERRVRELSEALEAEHRGRVEQEPVREFMRLKEFAARHAFSESTLAALVRRGMPVEGRGRLRRVPVQRADAWLAARA